MAKHDEMLLSQLEPGKFVPLLQKMAKHTRGRFPVAVGNLSRNQLLDVSSALQRDVELALETLQDYFECLHDAVEQHHELVFDAAALAFAMVTLRGAALLAYELLQQCHAQPPAALHQATQLLHDYCLLRLGNYPDLQDAVVRLCCSLWEHDCPNRTAVAAQTLPYLMVRALVSLKASDVKLCLSLKDTLELMDFGDKSIADTVDVMKAAAMSPAFLHRTEGRRFLAHLYNLDAGLARQLTQVMRNQVVSGRPSVLDDYGDVLLRAWREATGACIYEMENAHIQPLMKSAITARTPALAANLRAVLAPLHGAKAEAGVDAMLLRLYEPVLFRALSAANGQARRNALLLLLDVFPLTNPELSEVETDELMTRQFTALRSCFSDPCPVIRAEVVCGVCRLLGLYWDIIPAATTAVLLSEMTAKLAHDTVAPSVRVAVLEGMRLLLDSPHARPVLKKALGGLSSLLSDPSLRVREVMAALLVAVGNCKDLHFWEVVPIEQLLDTLATDAPSVSRLIQSLLKPSYFPSMEEGPNLVCKLLISKPAAGLAFCVHLAAPFVDDAAGGVSESCPASLPIEHLQQLAYDLKVHLLNTAAQLGAAVMSSPGQPRRKASRKGGASTSSRPGTQQKATAGKRRKGLSSAPSTGLRSGRGTPFSAQQPDGEDHQDEMVEEDAGVTPESWTAIAAGLAAICRALSGAVASEQSSLAEMERTFEPNDLLTLLKAAPGVAAMEHVLTMAALLSSTMSARVLRTHLFVEIAAGRLPSAPVGSSATARRLSSDGSGAAGAAAAAAGAARSPLFAAVGALVASDAGLKLVALTLHALKARPTLTRGGHAAGTGDHPLPGRPDDDAACLFCGDPEPPESMLLCDGCEATCHLHCLRLHKVPDGNWLCPLCEAQVQASSLAPRGAVRLAEALLDVPAGRQLLHSHAHFPALLDGLRRNAAALCVAAPPPAAAAGGDGASGSTGAGAFPEHAAGLSRWDAAGAASWVYCKAALHRGLMAVAEAADAAAAGGAPPEGGAVAQCAALLRGVGPDLRSATAWWKAAVTAPAGAPAVLQRLHTAVAVLKVLCEAHQMRAVDLALGSSTGSSGSSSAASGGDAGSGEYVVMCALAGQTASLCGGITVAALADAGEEDEWMHPYVQVAAEAMTLVVTLAKHLTPAARPPPAAAPRAEAGPATGEDEPRLQREAAAVAAATVRRRALHGLVAAVLQHMAQPGAEQLAVEACGVLGALLPLLPPADDPVQAGFSAPPGGGAWSAALFAGLGAALASGAVSIGRAEPPPGAAAAAAPHGKVDEEDEAPQEENRHPNLPANSGGVEGGKVARAASGAEPRTLQVAAAAVPPPRGVLSGEGGIASAEAALLVAAVREGKAAGSLVPRFAEAAAASWQRGDAASCCGAVGVLCLLEAGSTSGGTVSFRRQGGDTPAAVAGAAWDVLQEVLNSVEDAGRNAQAAGRPVDAVHVRLRQLLLAALPA